MKKMFICLFILMLALPVSSAFARLYIFDITANSLSVRTGPSPVYTSIATIYTGTDVVRTCEYPTTTTSCYATTLHNGVSFEMENMYYPNSSLGKYSDLATGWIAVKEGTVTYVSARNGAEVAKSGGTPSNYTTLYPSLGNPSSQIVPNGSWVFRGDRLSSMYAEDGNPNAWKLFDYFDYTNVVHMNGWHLNAFNY